MDKINLEDFANFYIEAVLNLVQGNYLSDLDVFYENVFKRVSEKTCFSTAQIIFLHHPFHWNLFLKDDSPLELSAKKNRGERGYAINVRNAGQETTPLEKSALVSRILKEYGELLKQRMDKIPKSD